MANPLYNQMNPRHQNMGIFDFYTQLQALKARGGDPNQQIQELLNSGKVSQDQYNAAVQKAQQLRGIFGGN